MSFSDQVRNIAVTSGKSMVLFSEAYPLHKESLPDGNRIIETLCGHWDDEIHTKKRAASLTDGTIRPVKLIDGRDLWRGLFQSDVENKFINGEYADVEELTDEEVSQLLPPPPTLP